MVSKPRYDLVGSLFADRELEELDLSLESFVRHAFAMRLAEPSGLEYVFPGSNSQATIRLKVVTHNDFPAINAITIQGKSNDFDDILGDLRGTIEADYVDVKIDDLVPSSSRLSYLSDYTAQLGDLRIKLRPGQDGKYVHKVSLMQNSTLDRKIIRIEDASLEPEDRRVLETAKRIRSQGRNYVENDESQDVYHDRATITKESDGVYFVNYSSSAVNGHPLPIEILWRFDTIYDQVSTQFTRNSFNSCKVIGGAANV